MASKWEKATVEDLVKRKILAKPLDGNHGSIHPKSKDFVDSGIPFIMASDLKNGNVNLNNCKFISENQAKSLRKGFAKEDDVLLSHKATIGRTAIVKNIHNDFIMLTPQVTYYRVLDKKYLNNRFLKYYFDSPEFQELFNTWAGGGSTRAYLGITGQLKLPILLPPLPEQKAIAHVLGTLDDKIELNRRMNETLESIAQAIFKSWFVDFDPVRAKAEGRDTGLPKDIAALFPDSFEDSELGEIPKGWEFGFLGDVLEQRNERVKPSSETASMPYVPIDCISAKSLFLSESKPGTGAKSSLTRFYSGDILFGAMRPYFHKVCIAPFDGTTRTTGFVLTPKAKEDFSFALMLLHQESTIDFATTNSTGSTIPYAQWKSSMENMPVLLPPKKLRIAFNQNIRDFLNPIPKKYFENTNLAKIRDSLLPKLISGKVEIQDTEKFAEELNIERN